jgi:UDP-N-acetylglucosamine 4-epimerase
MIQLNGKKVLVTGGAGFIGANLCDYLVKTQNEVYCLDDLSTGSKRNISHLLDLPNFHFIEGDIRDYNTCKEVTSKVEIVFHQAALGSVPRSIDNPLLTHSVNNTGFLNMLEASRINKIERFIYAASSSTYGDSKELPKVEDNIGKPLSPYAVTKLTNELYAHVFADLYGLKVIGLRYFNVFGRKQDPNGAYAAAIPSFIKLLLDGQPPVINGDGSQSRDFTYIDNVVQINILAALAENPEAFNQVYNVAFGAQTDLNELLKLINDELAKLHPEVAVIKPIYGPERVGDVKHSHADISKAKKLLNYNPEYNLEKGMKEAIKWYAEYFKQKTY